MNRLLLWMAPVSMVFLSGCGGGASDAWTESRPKTVAAGGVVTYQNKALEGATITLTPEDSSQKAAVGISNADGEFRLMTYSPGDGAVPGKYQVTIVKTATSSGPVSDSAPATDAPIVSEPLGSAIPKRYQTTADSGLTATVTEQGPNHFEFNLTD